MFPGQAKVICGHNPFIYATLVSDLREVESDDPARTLAWAFWTEACNGSDTHGYQRLACRRVTPGSRHRTKKQINSSVAPSDVAQRSAA